MIISPEQFSAEWFRKIPVQKRFKGNPGSKNPVKYKDIVTAFDIETTRIKEIEQAVMYVWQFQFGLEYTVIGRTWQEFIEFCGKLKSGFNENEKIITFVHNLSYEFQFLRDIYPFQIEDVFALDSRKVLKAVLFDCIELRCSYIHSNMSLSEYTKKMGAEHRKLSGEEFDYSKRRFPWTPISEKEMPYIVNDVLGLVEAITIEMQHDGDNLYTFPLTSTGYVRRDAKRAMRNVNHMFVKDQLPDLYVYNMCREAFRGGNTHANRFYAGEILKNVTSADRSSSYPEVICNNLYPVTEFFKAGAVTYRELLELIHKRKKAVLIRCAISGLRLRDKFYGAPYIGRDKCRVLRGALYDNGRVLEAEYIETTLTDIDFQIVLEQYDFDDFVPYDVAHARYGRLPQVLIDLNIKYYKAKTELKNVTGQELYYLKSKNKLNSIYGMMAQDPVKQTIEFKDDDFIIRDDDPFDILQKHNHRAFLCYQWGVWVTAHARYELEKGIRFAGENFVYADTDSVKYVGTVDWEQYNTAKRTQSAESGAVATDPQGVVHYMGEYEIDGTYIEFSTLGAKKYCYRENDNKPLSITIAGVTKKHGGAELEKHGGIKAFKPGFIFVEAGGNESVYNDRPEIKGYEIDGHKIDITSNVVIKPSTYTLGITGEYEKLLEISNSMLTFKEF